MQVAGVLGPGADALLVKGGVGRFKLGLELSLVKCCLWGGGGLVYKTGLL